RSRLLCRRRRLGSVREDDVDLAAHELGRNLAVPLLSPFGPAILDLDRTAFDPGELAQPLPEGGNQVRLRRQCAHAYEADRRQPGSLLLLRPHRERPRSRSAANERDELATAAHSITSSAQQERFGNC